MTDFETKLRVIINDDIYGTGTMSISDHSVSAIIDAFVELIGPELSQDLFPHRGLKNWEKAQVVGWNDYRAELLKKLGRGE